MRFPNMRMSCTGIPVLSVLSWPTRQAKLSVLSCPSGNLPDFLSELQWLSPPGCPLLVVLSLLLCSGHAVLCFLFWLYYPVCIFWLCCPGFLVRAFLFRLSCPDSPVLDVLYRLSCPSFLVPSVQF
jgi:hypothetical protein